MMPHGIDTSPVIAEYGRYCNRSGDGLSDNPNWCYTEWINVSPAIQSSVLIIVDAFASLHNDHTYQIQNADGTKKDYFYGSDNFSEFRRVWNNGFIPEKFRWSILIENLDKCYAYCENNGQIFFAGNNSIYYGHRNISELN